MGSVKAFVMDGVEYNVHVTKLTRKFSVLDTDQTTRTQGGRMYRDIIGTFYNYSMTVSSDIAEPEAMDAFWDAVSQPVESHVCTFPYNQGTLSQEMYITSGEQPVDEITDTATYWGPITLNYIAMAPEVTP